MRIDKINRETSETKIQVEINLDGVGDYQIESPLNFLNHMLETFARYALFDISIKAIGDIEVDQHHLVEDIALAIGNCINKCLGDKIGINRSGFNIYQMDDSIAQVTVDLGGRPYLIFNANFRRQFCGDFNLDLLQHFFESLISTLKANIGVILQFGKNDHHSIEAIFKSFGKALGSAVSLNPRINGVLSTKGVIDS